MASTPGRDRRLRGDPRRRACECILGQDAQGGTVKIRRAGRQLPAPRQVTIMALVWHAPGVAKMTKGAPAWIGLAGVDASDGPRALYWQQKLHVPMIVVALLALPGYVLDTARDPDLARLGIALDV